MNGKTAYPITTMDTLLWSYRWIYKNSGTNNVKVLNCWAGPQARFQADQIFQRGTESPMVKKAREARKLHHGIITPWARILIRVQTCSRNSALISLPLFGGQTTLPPTNKLMINTLIDVIWCGLISFLQLK